MKYDDFDAFIWGYVAGKLDGKKTSRSYSCSGSGGISPGLVVLIYWIVIAAIVLLISGDQIII